MRCQENEMWGCKDVGKVRKWTRRVALAGVVCLTAALVPAAAQGPSAPALRTRQHVTALASERFEGRLAGSAGERLAADYIVAELQRIGAKALPGRADYRLPFEFTAGTRDGGSSLVVTDATPADGARETFETTRDVQALSFSENGEVSGPVVFAGYGIVIPDGQGLAYDSYAGLDVANKVVLVLRYFPEDADQKTKGILARYSGLRYKAMAARQRGARAMVIVTGPRSPNAGQVAPMTFDTALAGSGLVAASVSGAAAAAMWRLPDRSLDEAQRALDTGNPHVAGFDLPDVSVTLRADVVREKRTGFNVVAYLPGSTGSAEGDAVGSSVDKGWIALGAHYDHLGRGDHGNSLAVNDEAGRIHAGADDNTSGTAAVLAIGELLATQPRRRHILLAFWSGEELGLIGSGAYVSQPPVPVEDLAAYLNFDMVGRMEDNKLTLQATGTSPRWGRLIEQANIGAGFDLTLQPDPYLPTDSASFNGVGVPTLNFFTGIHLDYHKPSDTADKIAYEDLDRIVHFAAALARRTADLDPAPEFTRVDQPAEAGGGRPGIRIFTGTVPDYATEVKGLLLSGVIGGGPAEQAGLRKGDVIVEIGGQTITNIYDYTYALDILKVGVPAVVVYMRDGRRVETTLTPAARR